MIDTIFIVGILLITVLAYLSSNSIFLTAGVFVLYLLYYFLIGRKKIVNYGKNVNRIHSCYHFINSFIITLSVKESIDDAYQSGIRSTNKELNEQTAALENLKVYDRIVYLRKYFNLAIFKMFINLLDMYQEQGGNILSMSDALMRETTRTEKSLTESTHIGNRYLVEYLILWLVTFLVLIFLRYGISDFYLQMLKTPIFIVLLFVFFMIVLVSIHMFIVRFTNLSVKEDKE